MPQPVDESCGVCKYFGVDQTHPTFMVCLRYPPQMLFRSQDALTPKDRFWGVWPIVNDNDWCGEFVRLGIQPVEAQ